MTTPLGAVPDRGHVPTRRCWLLRQPVEPSPPSANRLEGRPIGASADDAVDAARDVGRPMAQPADSRSAQREGDRVNHGQCRNEGQAHRWRYVGRDEPSPRSSSRSPIGARREARETVASARSGRQTRAALGAASGQNGTAGTSAHPQAETVRLGATAVIGLVGALHGRGSAAV